MTAGLSLRGPDDRFVGVLEVEAAKGMKSPMGGGLFSLLV